MTKTIASIPVYGVPEDVENYIVAGYTTRFYYWASFADRAEAFAYMREYEEATPCSLAVFDVASNSADVEEEEG